MSSCFFNITHALWFALAVAWQVGAGVVQRVPPRDILLRAIALLPACIPAFLWYPQLAKSKFQSDTVWVTLPWERLTPGEIGRTVWGALVLWIGIAIWQHRDRLRASIDPELLAAAGVLGLMYLLLPEKFQNTIEFNRVGSPSAQPFSSSAFPRPDSGGGSKWVYP